MKKYLVLICTLICGSLMATDVFDFKASVKVPTLKAGVRTYVSTSFKGHMYVDYDDSGEVTNATIQIKNGKSKAVHTLQLDEYSYGILGKANKNTIRSTPEIYLNSTNDTVTGISESHELITQISFAGCGSLKYLKGYTTGCGTCGDSTTVAGCAKINKISGSLTGKMICQCPDELDWDHTLIAGECGVLPGDLVIIRTSVASIWGNWSMTWNKKLSD